MRHLLRLGLLPSVATLIAVAASAQTVTVTTAADVVDVDWQTATLADLPGPDGKVSFSEAVIATDNTPGHQTIGFAVPQSEWTLQFLHPGKLVLTSLTGFYWRSDDEVTIDGTTQTTFTGDTNPDGCEVVFYGNTFYVNGDDSTLLGFDSSSIQVSGSNCLVQGNTGTMNITVFGGSGSLITGNECGTIKLDRSSGNVVMGNTMNRVRIQGFGASQPAANNRIGGPTPAERNFITGYGTYNSEGLPSGKSIELFDSLGTLIENNYIGTTPDGLAQGNTACNIGIGFSGDNTNCAIRDNLLSGILAIGTGPHHAGQLFGWAILLSGTGTNIEILNNRIGPDANGAPTLGSVWGIDVGNPVTNPWNGSDVRIEGNEIAGHIFNGVTVGRNVNGVRLSGNSIHDNGWLGIDLIPSGYGYGVTPNDALDADTGGNGMQNFPDIVSATREGAGVRVLGTLHSSPADLFTIELFASPGCHSAGNGEGQMFVGTTSATTDAAGNASFDVLVTAAVPPGWVITATATLEPIGATSEFSVCAAVAEMLCQPDMGFGGPGVSTLSVCGGDLSSGTTANLWLAGAAPNQLAFLAVGPFSNPTPIFGGTFVPLPASVVVPLFTDGQGTILIPGLEGGGGPASAYAQFLCLNPAQPQGIGFSNAVRLDFLP